MRQCASILKDGYEFEVTLEADINLSPEDRAEKRAQQAKGGRKPRRDD